MSHLSAGQHKPGAVGTELAYARSFAQWVALDSVT